MRAGVDRVCKVENSGCKLKVQAGGLGRRCHGSTGTMPAVR